MSRHKLITAESIRAVKLLPYRPPFIKPKKVRGAKAVGLRYEHKALDKLERLADRAGVTFVRSPWIEYVDGTGRNWCQPDGIFLDTKNSTGVCVEIKYKHTADSWFQLWKLYIPLLQILYPGYTFGAVEMVKWLDPAVVFPERFDLTSSPLTVVSLQRTSVHIWNPQRDPEN